jgi:hypothetical protein
MMTQEQERELFEAALAVSNITLLLARAKPDARHLTERHRRMLTHTSTNFAAASELLAELVADAGRAS